MGQSKKLSHTFLVSFGILLASLAHSIPRDCLHAVLEASSHPVDASFLVQNKYGTAQADPRFVIPFTQAIRRLTLAMQSTKNVDAAQVKTWLYELASVRSNIALSRQEKHSMLYGFPLPESPESFAFLKFLLDLGDEYTYDNFHTVDVIGPSSDVHFEEDPARPFLPLFEAPRHSHFYDLAQIAEVRHDQRLPRHYVAGRNYPLSTVEHGTIDDKFSEPQVVYFVRHPSLPVEKILRNHAYELLASAFKSRNLNSVAEAYYLLMHATPFYRGTPSIVEAYLDAFLRARFGYTLKPKSGEAFWNAIFFDAHEKAFTIQELLSCFSP